MKTCRKCRETKSKSAFYKDNSKKDGVRSWCKVCTKISLSGETYRASSKKYEHSCKGKIARARYKRSAKGKATNRRYRRSPAGKAATKRGAKKYLQTEHGKARRRKFAVDYRRKRPDMTSAVGAVSHAVQAGRLPRISTQVCVSCGEQAENYHHHKGYTEQHRLDVTPLCKLCHVSAHA